MKPSWRRELLRPPEVVGVEEGDEAPARRADAGVARRRRAAVLRPAPSSRMRASRRRQRLGQRPRSRRSSRRRRASISQSATLCARTEATAAASVAAAFQTGVITETAGRPALIARSGSSRAGASGRRRPRSSAERDAEHVGLGDVSRVVGAVEAGAHHRRSHAPAGSTTASPGTPAARSRGEEDARDQEQRPGQHRPDVPPGREEAEEHAVQRADAEPEQRGQHEGRRRPRPRSRFTCEVDDQDDAGEEHDAPTTTMVRKFSTNFASTASSARDHRIGQQPLVRADRRWPRPPTWC